MAETRKTATKPAKKTTTKSSGAKASGHKNNTSKLICIILVAVAALAVITGVAICIANNLNNTVTIEDGNGGKVKAKYTSVEDYKYSIAVPTDFKKLSEEDAKKQYGSTELPAAIYGNDNNTVYIAFGKLENTLNNDMVKDYVDAMKTILATSMDVIESKTYTVGDHNVGTIRFVSELSGEKFYTQMLMFSYDGKLATITFNCTDEMRSEWETVGQTIMNSLKF